MSCVMLTGAGTFMAEELLDDESINELAGKIGQEKLCNAGVAGLELDFSKGVDGCKIVDCACVTPFLYRVCPFLCHCLRCESIDHEQQQLISDRSVRRASSATTSSPAALCS